MNEVTFQILPQKAARAHNCLLSNDKAISILDILPIDGFLQIDQSTGRELVQTLLHFLVISDSCLLVEGDVCGAYFLELDSFEVLEVAKEDLIGGDLSL